MEFRPVLPDSGVYRNFVHIQWKMKAKSGGMIMAVLLSFFTQVAEKAEFHFKDIWTR
jgi:hypothetical protein